jgi:hypothetical protein
MFECQILWNCLLAISARQKTLEKSAQSHAATFCNSTFIEEVASHGSFDGNKCKCIQKISFICYFSDEKVFQMNFIFCLG